MRTVRLGDTDFDATFIPPMRDVSSHVTPEVWSYVDAIPKSEIGLLGPIRRTVDHIYLSGDARFHHFLLATSAPNVCLVVVGGPVPSEILGHHVLDLNEKYGRQAPAVLEAWRSSSVICAERSVQPLPPSSADVVGIALHTLGLDPVNGMRVHPVEEASGWYIWCGDNLSTDPDFFQPLHIAHLAERCPNVLPYLALPPGWRFLLGDDDYVDTWHDRSLLSDR